MRARAGRICAECIVQPECLEFALRVHERHGIRDGLAEAEGRLLPET
jgi:hypothetical protein